MMSEPWTNKPIELEQVPRFSPIDLRPLPKKAMWLAFMSTFLSGLFIVLIGSIANGFFVHWPWSQAFYAYLALGLWTLLALAFVPLVHRKKGYCLREHDIIYQHGLFQQKTVFLPINRIQHIETERGPLQRKLGLSTIKFFSAGGASADLHIAGLTQHDAESLRQLVLERTRLEEETSPKRELQLQSQSEQEST